MKSGVKPRNYERFYELDFTIFMFQNNILHI